MASTAIAQFPPLPPSSVSDGIMIYNGGSWTPSNQPQAADPLQIASNLSLLNQKGGTVRVIFWDAESNWDGGFGYAYSRNALAASSFTLAPLATDLPSGSWADIKLSAGSALNFDLWTNGGPNVFLLFDSLVNAPANGSVSWNHETLDAETWVANIQENVGDSANTILTYSVGVQFFTNEGSNGGISAQAAANPVAVPEPATYGLFGMLTLGALAFWRRRSLSLKR